MPRLRSLFVDLSLRKSIALALIIGLALPVGVSTWMTLSERRAARMIFITGDSLREGAKRFLETCARPFIEKPSIPDEIRRLTAAMLRSKGTAATGSGSGNSPR